MSAVKNELWHLCKLQTTFTYIANTEQPTWVELLHNSTLVTKEFIQNAQCPKSNTVNYETKRFVHPQVMCDWNKADHYRFHFKETGLQSFTTTQFNIPGTLHNQNSYEHLPKVFFPTCLHYSSTNQKTKLFPKATAPEQTFLYYFPLHLPHNTLV